MELKSLAPLFGAWISLTGLVVALSGVIQRTARDSTREYLANLFSESDPKDWVRAANRAFLDIFDRLYGGKQSHLDEIIWSGLLITPAVTVATAFVYALALVNFYLGEPYRAPLFTGISRGIADYRQAASIGLASEVLLTAFGAAFMFAMLRFLMLRTRHFSLRFRAAVALVASLVIAPGIIVYGLWVISNNPCVRPPAVQDCVARLEQAEIITDVFNFYSFGLVIEVNSVDFLIVSGVVFIAALVTGLLPPVRIGISPLKALASSIFFMLIIALIRPDAVASFFDTLENRGLALFAFVGFNIFADAISLYETRWLLKRGGEASIPQLLGLVVLDLGLSAVIFLFLPTVLGEVQGFLEGIMFGNQASWRGILFWTTFSTSIMLYMFVIAALLVRPLAALFRVVRILLDVESQPVLCFTVAVVLVLLVAFVAGGVVMTLSRTIL